MCVLHIKPFFLPVDIPSQQVSMPILQSQRDAISYVVTKLRHGDTALVCGTQSILCNAMTSYWIRQARHAHYMNERKQKKHTRQIPLLCMYYYSQYYSIYCCFTDKRLLIRSSSFFHHGQRPNCREKLGDCGRVRRARVPACSSIPYTKLCLNTSRLNRPTRRPS